MTDSQKAELILYAVIGYPIMGLMLASLWPEPPKKEEPLAEYVAERRSIARAALTLPLWGWIGLPVLVLSIVGGLLWAAFLVIRAGVQAIGRLLRAAFPGDPPTDFPTSQGGAYR